MLFILYAATPAIDTLIAPAGIPAKYPIKPEIVPIIIVIAIFLKFTIKGVFSFSFLITFSSAVFAVSILSAGDLAL